MAALLVVHHRGALTLSTPELIESLKKLQWSDFGLNRPKPGPESSEMRKTLGERVPQEGPVTESSDPGVQNYGRPDTR